MHFLIRPSYRSNLYLLRNMSSAAAIAKLPLRLRELVNGVIKDSSVNSEDKPEVTQWIEKVASGQVGKAEGLKVCL
jgi:hypothetical protein